MSVSVSQRPIKPGGRLALADIISEKRLPESIKADADLWAACIGGAEQVESYTDLIEAAGFGEIELRENADYEFTSERAANACGTYGVKSVSLVARKS